MCKVQTTDDLTNNFINQSLSANKLSSFVSTHSINADTGTTGNFISLPDAAVLLDIKPVGDDGISVALPNGHVIKSTHTATLNLPSLPMSARAAHIFPTLTGSLLSIGMLTDAGLTAIYTADAVTIQDSAGTTVLSGYRSPYTRLWMIDLPAVPVPLVPNDEEPQYHAAAVINHENDSQLVHFYHATLGSPAISTFVEATARGYLNCLPHLTVSKIRRNKPHTLATSFGHLDQTRKNYKSTKSTIIKAPIPTVPPLVPLSDDVLDTFPLPEPAPTNTVYTKVQRTHQNYMDGSGRFPVKSRTGNEYTLLMYSHDANYIHVETMKRGTGRLLDAYKRGNAFFKARGFQPKFERLDNETSKELQEFMQFENISFQYVPPHCKRRNAAERGLRTFKNHFIATLCTVDKDFPLQLWDTILPQTEMTLNLLRGSSAYRHGSNCMENITSMPTP